MKQIPYLIIGNSTAAMGAVEGIRRCDQDGRIVIVADEPHHTYSRPLISYLLGGQVGEDDMFYRPDDFYEQNNIETMLGTEVIEIDPKEKVATTAARERIAYETCLVATGGEPIIPPNIEGADSQGVFTFTTWEDARDIDNYMRDNDVDSALIVGGGLIGLKSMEALVERGVRTTLVELADSVLNTTFDARASELAQDQMEKAGVDVRCETTVSRIGADDGKVSCAVLTDDTSVECSIVIFAIGVSPRVGLVEKSDIQVDSGILVDEHMESSVPGTYAAGDVAQARLLLSDEKRPVPIFPNAFRQGLVAGFNMAGDERIFEGSVAMNSVDVFGLPTISVGVTDPDGDDYECLSSFDFDPVRYRKIVLKDNILVGAIFVGDIDRAGIITGLIREQVDVSDFKESLLCEDFGLIHLPTEYRKHVVSGLGIEV